MTSRDAPRCSRDDDAGVRAVDPGTAESAKLNAHPTGLRKNFCATSTTGQVLVLDVSLPGVNGFGLSGPVG